MDTTKSTPVEAFRFLARADEAPTIAGTGDAEKRKFEGVAYSGDVIEGHWHWGRVVFDLLTLKAPQRLPILLGHDREKIVGFSEELTIGSFVKVRGVLSSATKEGRHVAATSDEGFPWQMSVHIEPARVEEVGAGEEVTVNGRDFTGPINVFRNSAIREISFTPTGWDSNTTAIALAAARGDEATPAARQMTAEAAYRKVTEEAGALASRAQLLMQDAAEHGQRMDVLEAMKLARLPDNHTEVVAFKARKLQYQAEQRGQYLDAADAVHRARHW